MNSNNTVNSFQNDGYFGTILIYALIAFVFFIIGRNYDRIRTEVKSRTTEKRGNKVSARYNSFLLVF